MLGMLGFFSFFWGGWHAVKHTAANMAPNQPLHPFHRATQWVAANLTLDKPAMLSLFETNIRIVGSLMAAHWVQRLP